MAEKWDPGFAGVVGAYHKPWYLLCGETAVGKTAALWAANLPRALGPDGKPITDKTQGLNGTYLFDWWFFDDAVVLDSAGDLIANPDQRWTSFLDRVTCSPKTDPVVMRVYRPVRGEETLDEAQEAHPRAGRPQAA